MKRDVITQALQAILDSYGDQLRIENSFRKLTDVLSDLWGQLDQKQYVVLLEIGALLLQLSYSTEMATAHETLALLHRLQRNNAG